MNEVIEELRQQIITRQLEFDTARKLSRNFGKLSTRTKNSFVKEKEFLRGINFSFLLFLIGFISGSNKVVYDVRVREGVVQVHECDTVSISVGCACGCMMNSWCITDIMIQVHFKECRRR